MTRNEKPFGAMAVLALCSCTVAWSQAAQDVTYNVYYGSLHNHCEISDGTGTVEEAYETAKYEGGLDFFSLSDHAEFMSQPEWLEMKAAADRFDEPGRFTAFWGFEWSSVVYGHLTVTGSVDYASSLATGTSHFRELNRWLDDCNCVAFLNHPGDYDGFGMEFNHFNISPSSNLAGTELWNGTTGFEKYYRNDGYDEGDGGLGYYDEALTRGWRIGASGACDIHGGNWGSGSFRMAVLAGALDRESLMEAFRARRFYSTLDKNLKMSFKVDGMEMGSVMDPGRYPAEVRLHDADQETFTGVELVSRGQVVSTFPLSSEDPVLSFEITADPSDYYYVVVTQEDGDQAISSPFFFNGSMLTTDGIGEPVSSPDAWTARMRSGGILTVCIPPKGHISRICLADISGRILLDLAPGAESCVDISVTGLQPGLYLLFDPENPRAGCHKISVW